MEFVVYTRRIALALRKEGFNIIRTDINPTHPQFECWVFKKTKELVAAFERLAKK